MTYHLRPYDGRCGYSRQRHDQYFALRIFGFLAWFAQEYVNVDCPERCSAPHPWPDPSEVETDHLPACPETNRHYEWCDLCEDWVRRYGRWSENYRTDSGESMCSPGDHGMFFCDYCDRLLPDDRYAGDGACSRCYEPEDEDYGRGRGWRDGEPLTTCPRCSTTTVHVHELTEEYLCDCAAIAAHLRGEAVLFADDAPIRKVMRAMGMAA